MALFDTLPLDVVAAVVRRVAHYEPTGVAQRLLCMLDAGGALEEAVRMMCVTWTEVASDARHQSPSAGAGVALSTESDLQASCALAERVGNDVMRLDITYAPLTRRLAAFISRHLPNIAIVNVATMGYGAHAEAVHDVLAACGRPHRLRFCTRYLSRGVLEGVAANLTGVRELQLDLSRAYVPRVGLSFPALWSAVCEAKPHQLVVARPPNVHDAQLQLDLLNDAACFA